VHVPTPSFRLRHTLAVLSLVALFPSLSGAPLGAQDVQLAGAESASVPAARRTDAPPRGMVPISMTTVMHYVLEPDSTGTARVGYVLLVRGPSGWWARPTGSGTERMAADLEMQAWTIGDTQYTIGYSARYRRLMAFGRLFNLVGAPVIMVTLGDTPDGVPDIRAGELTSFRLRTPSEFPSRFIAESPDIREFAGLP
jgi:hypothetical protein